LPGGRTDTPWAFTNQCLLFIQLMHKQTALKIYIKIYMRGAPPCFGFSQPSSGSYCMCFAKVTSINNQLKYALYRIFSV
jgi:hypothetical protein